jgi:hypothetical protein
MSTRPLIYPVRTLVPLRQAVGSNDATLIDRMVEGYAALIKRRRPDMEEAIREMGRALVGGQLSDGQEPGEWEFVILPLAQGLGLLERDRPVNDDWKWFAWADYEQEVANELAEYANQMLRWLVHGRPLKANAMDRRGSYYAWLETDEVSRLLSELDRLQEANPIVEEIVEGFHVELIEWLESCHGKSLLLLAS